MPKAKLDWALFEKAAAAVKQAGGAYKDSDGKTQGLLAPGVEPPPPPDLPESDPAAEARRLWQTDPPSVSPQQRSINNRVGAGRTRDSRQSTSSTLQQALDRLFGTRSRRPSPPPGWQEPQDTGFTPPPPPGWREPQDTGFTPSPPPPGWRIQPSTSPPVRPRRPLLDPSGWSN